MSKVLDEIERRLGAIDHWAATAYIPRSDLRECLQELREIAESEAAPPMLLKAVDRLSCAAIERLKAEFEKGIRRGRIIVLDAPLEIFQLVDGRWQKLGESGASDVRSPS